jgi:hypothetical protein
MEIALGCASPSVVEIAAIAVELPDRQRGSSRGGGQFVPVRTRSGGWRRKGPHGSCTDTRGSALTVFTLSKLLAFVDRGSALAVLLTALRSMRRHQALRGDDIDRDSGST